jgi:hypothetical protein
MENAVMTGETPEYEPWFETINETLLKRQLQAHMEYASHELECVNSYMANMSDEYTTKHKNRCNYWSGVIEGLGIALNIIELGRSKLPPE